MQRYPKNRHYAPRPYGAASSGGSIISSESPPTIFLDFDTVEEVFLGSYNLGGGAGNVPVYSSFGVDVVEKCFGVLQCSTGTSTAGGSDFGSPIQANIVLGTGFVSDLTMRSALDTLSDGVNTFVAHQGLGGPSIVTTNPVNGVFFRYTHAVNAGKWQAVCRSGGVETAADTGVAADVNVFHLFRTVVNGAGTSVEFYIDGVLVATIATNIPTGNTKLLSYFGKIEKSLGAAARSFYFDYVKHVPSISGSR